AARASLARLAAAGKTAEEAEASLARLDRKLARELYEALPGDERAAVDRDVTRQLSGALERMDAATAEKTTRARTRRAARGRARPAGAVAPVSRLLEVRIEKLAPTGEGIVRNDDGVGFVAGALPGELVATTQYEVKKRFWRGRLEAVLEASPDRVEGPHAGCA